MNLMRLFDYDFMVRAVVIGPLVALCASLLGVSLVLKRYSMIGDGLSHVGFGALAVATATGAAPMAVAIPVVSAAAVLLLRIGERAKIKGDAAISLISASALAIGVAAVSIVPGVNIDFKNYMFGNILATQPGDLVLSGILSAVVIALFVLFYHKIFAVTFDETFSRAVGIRAGAYNLMIAVLTAVTIVLGMRLMGAMLISALIIFPPLTAMRVCKRFLSVILCAAAVSVVCFLVGAAVSFLYSLPTGASVVLANLLAFLLFAAAGFLRERLGRRKAS